MKIEIPLQFFLVCFLILGVSVFLGALYLQKAEPFTDAASVSSSDYDIQLQACPSGSSSFNDKGDIFCCDGTIVNGLCNGRTVCSVSAEKPNMPSCVNLLRKELREKAGRFCPPSLPNYFEDSVKKTSGCTDGKRKVDGTTPLRADQKTCTIYSSYADNQNKMDSCDNIKRRDTYKCPSGKVATLVAPRSGKPVLVQCTFTSNTTPQPITCFSDDSYIDHLNAMVGDWRGTLTKESKLAFCSNAQRYYLDRSLTDQDLLYIEGPYVDVTQRKQCPTGMKANKDGATCSATAIRPACSLYKMKNYSPCYCPPGMNSYGDGSACRGGDRPACALWGNPGMPRC
jgi:hypothetical protein